MQKNENLYEEIAVIAYDLYEKRGYIHGYHDDDWIDAEKIVIKSHAKEPVRKAKAVSSAKKKKATNKTKPASKAKSKTLKSSPKKSVKTTKKTIKNKENRFEDIVSSLSSISEIDH